MQEMGYQHQDVLTLWIGKTQLCIQARGHRCYHMCSQTTLNRLVYNYCPPLTLHCSDATTENEMRCMIQPAITDSVNVFTRGNVLLLLMPSIT